MPLRRKILLGIVPLFILSVAVSVALQNKFQEEEMIRQARSSAWTYGEVIRESLVSMMVNNLEVDGSFLERVNHLAQFDTLRIVVNNLHLRDEVMTPARRIRLSGKYDSLSARDDAHISVLQRGEPYYETYGDLFRGVIPFKATNVCQKCHAVPVGYVLGAADMRISFARVSKAADDNWKRTTLIFVAFAGVIIATAVVMFRRFVSAPVDRLVEATWEIGKGNLNHRIVPRKSNKRSRDELDFLSAQFERMRVALKDKIEQLDRANRSLVDRNKEVENALKQLKQAQEELVRSERLAVTGKLSAQLSHEINNPIHNIHSLLESSLRKINGNDQARELLSVALEEVARMAKLTRQMLDFYRGSVQELEHDLVDIEALLGDVIRLYGETFAQQHIDLVYVPSDEKILVRGSRDKLKQVMLNLVINARDAILASRDEESEERGSIIIRSTLKEKTVRIEVQDSGCGIAPENLEKIFDAFFTTKKEVSGVGLGLSVSYAIIHQHHGTITVDSTVGEGTTFIIALPFDGENHE